MLQYGSYLGTPPPDSDWQCGDQINRSKLRGGGTDDDGDNATPSTANLSSLSLSSLSCAWSSSSSPSSPALVAASTASPPLPGPITSGTSLDAVVDNLEVFTRSMPSNEAKETKTSELNDFVRPNGQ